VTARLLGHAALTLTAAGLLGQARPRHLPALLRARHDTGTSPATLIAVAAAHRPDTPAVIDERGAVSYRDLDTGAARLAAGIRTRFGMPGQVAVLCRNHRDFLLAAAAGSRLGADLLFLNTEFAAPQLHRVLAGARPDLVVADQEFLPRLAGVDVPVLVAWQDTDTAVDQSTVDELVAGHEPWRPPRRVRTGALTLLTSGTTGAPRGAPRRPTALALLGPAVTVLRRTGLRADDPVLVAPPLFHGFGLAVWALAALLRSPVVLRRRFDPRAALTAITAHRVAALAAVPVMLHRILALPTPPAADRTALRAVISGGSALRPELAERFQDAYGPVLFNGYGASEIGIATLATPADLRTAPGTVGRPTLGSRIRVLDAAHRPLPAGTRGTVFVGGPLVFAGYADGGTKDTAGGLMSTGDVGHLDPAGRLHLAGRADDMIVSGGENVYPGQVEDVLARHPGVGDVAVVGVDDPEFGQRLVAYLVPRDPVPTADELAGHVRAALARYQVPRAFVFLDELPRTATGKVQRARLPRDGEVR
jgi:acyl-CoA synthetase (AMP-forming)/AMP-acid ligase II